MAGSTLPRLAAALCACWLLPAMAAASVYSRSVSLVQASSAADILPDNAECRLAMNLRLTPPYCSGSFTNCLIDKIRPRIKKLQGKCDSALVNGSYCTSGEFNFAVGVKGIPPYGPAACETCSCNLHPNMKGSNKARCDCDPLPACYVNSKGKALKGKGCGKYSIQRLCLVTKPGTPGGSLAKEVNKGKCEAYSSPQCVSAGPNWGPIFYKVGATGVPYPGDRCKSCTCGYGGKIKECVAVAGCTDP